MICKPCRDAADGLRKTHPKDCDCNCQHKPVKEGQIVR